MTVDEETYKRLEDLPFASKDGKNTPKITEPITFSLAKDPTGKVTLFPIHDASQVPKTLLKVIQHEINYVIKEGTTYPYHEIMDFDQFVLYWFSAFVAVSSKVTTNRYQMRTFKTNPKTFGEPTFWEHFT